MRRLVHSSAAVLLVVVSAQLASAQPECPGSVNAALNQTLDSSTSNDPLSEFAPLSAVGEVDVTDYSGSLGASDGSIDGLSVPEPASAILLLLAAMSTVALLRRNRGATHLR